MVARKRSASAARLGTSVFAQIALGCAVVETKARWVTSGARSVRVTHEGGMPGLPKRLPGIRLSPDVAGPSQQRRRHTQDVTEQPLREAAIGAASIVVLWQDGQREKFDAFLAQGLGFIGRRLAVDAPRGRLFVVDFARLVGKAGPTYSDLASISVLSLRMAAMSSPCAASRCVSGLAASRDLATSFATLLGGGALRQLRRHQGLETCVVPHLAHDSCLPLACRS